MNKTELAEAVAKNVATVSRADAQRVIESMLGVIQEVVARGEEVQIVGFGTFKPTERAERKGRNPQTGEELTISAARTPKFTPGKAFKDAVNSGK